MPKKKIEMYTMKVCPYCVQAKALMAKYGVTDITEHRIDQMENGREEVIERTGGFRSVPQIFVDGKYIGDEDKLKELHSKGELEAILK